MAQGTIKDYDDDSRTGSLLLDDRTEIGIDPVSTQGADLRLLRLGQRVKFEIAEQDGAKVARRLRILTID
jgi:cold shock CspA family protein